MDIPERFDCIKEEDIPQIIKWALAEANPLYPTPVTWNKKDLQQQTQLIFAASLV